jgi:hypothetical protein
VHCRSSLPFAWTVSVACAVALVGCSGGDDSGKQPVRETASDASLDAPTGDAPPDGPSSDGDAAACAPVDAVCPADGGAGFWWDAGPLGFFCVPTWSEAQNRSLWCAQGPGWQTSIVPSCNGFNLVVVGGADTSYFFEYDTTTGALVGVEYHSLGGITCVAGRPSGITLAGCIDGAVPEIDCSDGTDAQTGAIRDGEVDAPIDSTTDGSLDAAPDVADAMGSCTGEAPDCFGNDLQNCCGNDPSGVAVCQAGQWMCGAVAAPGCNGRSCIGQRDL